jgi:hypothetical protein
MGIVSLDNDVAYIWILLYYVDSEMELTWSCLHLKKLNAKFLTSVMEDGKCYNIHSLVHSHAERFYTGHVMAQVVSRWAFTTEVQFSPCGICGRQSGTGTDYSPTSLVFLSVSFNWDSILIYHLGDEQKACWTWTTSSRHQQSPIRWMFLWYTIGNNGTKFIDMWED